MIVEDNGKRQVIRAADASLRVGFHPPECGLYRSWRWTDGAAELPHQRLDHPVAVELQLRGGAEYWLAPAMPEREARRA
jgi:hypothetical protein